MIALGHAHRVSVLGAAALAASTVVGGSSLLLASGFLLLVVLVVAWPSFHAPSRGRGRRVLVHAATGIALVGCVRLALAADADAVFLVLMLGIANRALLRAGTRDDLVVLGASGVLLSAGTIVTSGLTFLVVIVLIVPAIVGALWTSTMLAAAERLPEPERADQTRRTLARALPRGLAALAIGGVALTALGFAVSFIFPRYRFSPFLQAGSLGALPGASNDMELRTGGVGDLDDSTVVLRVFPAEGAAAPNLDGLYARMYVLDRFDGRRFSATNEGHFAMLGAISGRPSLRVVGERIARGGVHHPVAAIGREAPWGVSGSGVHFEASGGLVVDQGPWRSLEYGAHADRGLLPMLVAERREETMAARERELPDAVDPRVRALGERLAEGRATEAEKVAALLGYFGRGGFRYSTDALGGEADDPIVRFLFEAKEGHCELYAGALAVLARAAGLRARVATGYYGGSWNALGGFHAFRQQDAHAWVEVYVSGEGWRWFDATPPDSRPRPQVSMLARLRDLWDVANAAWFTSVVDYDARRQRGFYEDLGRRATQLVRNPGKSAGSVFDKVGEIARAWAEGRAVGGIGPSGVLAALSALGGAAYGVVAWRRRRPAQLGVRLRRLLGDAGRVHAPLGVLLAERDTPERRAAIAAYEAWRFGGGPIAPARQAIAALERAERPRRRRDAGAR
jgi:hypothetical protein